MRAYRKDGGGQLEIASVVEMEDGFYTKLGTPLYSANEIENLVGWPDKLVEVYKTELGDIFLIPVNMEIWMEEQND